MRFTDQVVLVAGGTGALGRAVALAFLAEGARVAVTSRRPEEASTLAAEVGAARERLRGLAGDVADPAVAVRMAADLIATEGRIDVLVNAVGGWAGGANLWETGPDAYQGMRLHPRVWPELTEPRLRPSGHGEEPDPLVHLPRERGLHLG